MIIQRKLFQDTTQFKRHRWNTMVGHDIDHCQRYVVDKLPFNCDKIQPSSDLPLTKKNHSPLRRLHVTGKKSLPDFPRSW